MSTVADLLKDVPLFKFLSDREREDLGQSLETVSHAKGAEIFRVGDPGDSLYVIGSGEVEIFFKNNTGVHVVLEVARSGDFFGELSLLDPGPRSASVRALEDVEMVRVSRARLEQFLQTHPQAAMSFLASMGKRMRVSAEQLRHTASRNVNEVAEDKQSVIQRGADWIASFAGSIPFLLLNAFVFSTWMAVNVFNVPGVPHFDPLPFGILAFGISIESLFLSVFVLLSQNSQSAKDRVRANIEYDVNLKAELEVMHLHEKIDRLNADVLERLEKMQRSISGK